MTTRTLVTTWLLEKSGLKTRFQYCVGLPLDVELAPAEPLMVRTLRDAAASASVRCASSSGKSSANALPVSVRSPSPRASADLELPYTTRGCGPTVTTITPNGS